MRRDIDRHPERIKGILLDDGVRKTFLDGVSRQESRAVKAFVDTNSGNALKTKPKVSLHFHYVIREWQWSFTRPLAIHVVEE